MKKRPPTCDWVDRTDRFENFVCKNGFLEYGGFVWRRVRRNGYE